MFASLALTPFCCLASLLPPSSLSLFGTCTFTHSRSLMSLMIVYCECICMFVAAVSTLLPSCCRCRRRCCCRVASSSTFAGRHLSSTSSLLSVKITNTITTTRDFCLRQFNFYIHTYLLYNNNIRMYVCTFVCIWVCACMHLHSIFIIHTVCCVVYFSLCLVFFLFVVFSITQIICSVPKYNKYL